MRYAARRLAAALLAPWLAFVLAEPVAVHPCAMHDGAAAVRVADDMHGARSSQDARSHADRPSHEHAHHGAPSAPEATAPASDGPTESHHGACLCVGDCCAAGTAVAAADRFDVPAAASVAVAAPVTGAVSQRAVSWAQYRLPWSNGPPAVA